MAKLSVNKFYGAVLFLTILQATCVSALECYECDTSNDDECKSKRLPDKFLVTSNERFQYMTEETKEKLMAKEIKLTTGPTCVKWQMRSGGMIRFIMPEGPAASDLDESGCIWYDHGRICFCNQDKCNTGPSFQFNQSSALKCYVCEFGMRAERDKLECLQDNLPAELLFDQTTSLLLTDITNWIVDVFKEYQMRPGPFCVKSSSKMSETVVRLMLPEAPETSYLDESGCFEMDISKDRARACFCNQDKCNNGPVTRVAESSALQCYACIVGPNLPTELAQKDCLNNHLPAEFLVNVTTARSLPAFQREVGYELRDVIRRADVPMRPGPFCVKILPNANDTEGGVMRLIIPEAPAVSSLDESGCMKINDFLRACFCNQDKCNGPTIQVNQSSALECYGCILGAHEELSEHNQEACLEENPPDELVVNATSSIPSFDRFLQGLTNYNVNSSEIVKGPFCVKVSHEEDRYIFRYIVEDGPDAKYLDDFGCREIDNGRRICFCNENKCNSGC